MFPIRRILALAGLLYLGLGPTARAVEQEPPNDPAASLSTLGRKPDWNELEKYQKTITYDEFLHLLDDAYCTHGFNPDLIAVDPGGSADRNTQGRAGGFHAVLRENRCRPAAARSHLEAAG